jgi:Phycobilisome protein
MDTALQSLIYAADDHYLSDADLDRFNRDVASLGERLEAYEYIRDRELAILQPAVDYLTEEFLKSDAKLLERAVTHWLSILRYAAMAMLLNNPEYLSRRLLEWLPDLVDVYALRDIELALYRLILVQLKSSLSHEQVVLIKPYLDEAYAILLKTKPALQTTP